MNKIMKIVGIVLLVVGVVVAAITDVAVAEYIAVAVAFAGAAITCVDTYKKSEKKDWKVILSIALIAAGAFLLGLASVSTEVVSEIVTAVAGVVALILGILIPILTKSDSDSSSAS